MSWAHSAKAGASGFSHGSRRFYRGTGTHGEWRHSQKNGGRYWFGDSARPGTIFTQRPTPRSLLNVNPSSLRFSRALTALSFYRSSLQMGSCSPISPPSSELLMALSQLTPAASWQLTLENMMNLVDEETAVSSVLGAFQGTGPTMSNLEKGIAPLPQRCHLTHRTHITEPTSLQVILSPGRVISLTD
eukprot:GHVN01016768.1.p1 GENE.GHVN01016768.1~~GHVN01016768.1.p1  ORF type:complete len:188 (-),score=42.79 GHVN01016768.1:579-1142(-)